MDDTKTSESGEAKETVKKEPEVKEEPEEAKSSADSGTKEDAAPSEAPAENAEKNTKQEPSDEKKEEPTTPPKPESSATDDNRKNWDFTARKVMVKNTLKYVDKKKMQKMVDAWIEGTGIKVHKIKKPPSDNWVVLTLDKEEHVPKFIEHVNNGNFLNKKKEKVVAIKVVEEEDKKEYGNGKRPFEGSQEGGLTKRQRSAKQVQEFKPRVVTEEEIRDKMMPLWRKTYKQQREEKMQQVVKRCAIRVVKEIKSKFRDIERECKRNKNRKKATLYNWLNEKRVIEVAPILHAKDIVRNKCEFTFGPKYILDDSQSSSDEEVKKEDAKEEEEKPATDGIKKEEDAPMEEDTTTASSKDAKMDDAATAIKEEETTADSSKDANMDEAATIKEEEEKKAAPEPEPKIKMIPSIGSMARGWNGGVSHPGCCRNIPSEAVALVDIVEKFLQDSPMPTYNVKVHQGFWRTMVVRSSRQTNECMIIFVHAPITGGLGSKGNDKIDNYSPELFESEKARLVSMVTGVDLPVFHAKVEEDRDPDAKPDSFLKVTSVFFQEFDQMTCPPPDHPVQHAYGVKAITEKLGNCTFQISPGAFFQVNTKTAEVLYNVVVEKVREVSPKPEDTLCFDVCCGTGTIGLTLMKEGVVGKVVGVDISAPAIEDAKVNARLNGFGDDEKTRFVAARAENVMQDELRRNKNPSGKVVAVVDPAREGLHGNVLKALRGFPQIDRIVYVSCNPTGSLVPDAAILCNPPSKRYRGRPFRPTFAQPVDMFPYSDHCELVMVFDRMTDEEIGEGNAKE